MDIPLDADVIVEVVRREALPGSRCLLTVRLRLAGLTAGRQFQGEGPTWQESALLVADSVRRWVNENLDAPASTTNPSPRGRPSSFFAPYDRAAIIAASAPATPASTMVTTAMMRPTTVKMPT